MTGTNRDQHWPWPLRVQSIADDVVAAGRVVLQSAPEEIREVGDVDRGPVLTSDAEHDQVAGIVTG